MGDYIELEFVLTHHSVVKVYFYNQIDILKLYRKNMKHVVYLGCKNEAGSFKIPPLMIITYKYKSNWKERQQHTKQPHAAIIKFYNDKKADNNKKGEWNKNNNRRSSSSSRFIGL